MRPRRRLRQEDITLEFLEGKLDFVAWLVNRHPHHLWLFERLEREITAAQQKHAALERVRQIAERCR